MESNLDECLLESDVLDEIFSEWEPDSETGTYALPTSSSVPTKKHTQSENCDSEKSEISSSVTSEEKHDIREHLSSPLARFRPGYLWVTDLTRQNWCEQQLYYTFTVPTIKEENPIMTAGTDLHLARGQFTQVYPAVEDLEMTVTVKFVAEKRKCEIRKLAVHDVVQVSVQTNEDIWAIKVLNLHSSVNIFLQGGKIAREIPVFGAPFDEEVFVVGLIDELRFDPDSYTIDLSELKTRQSYQTPTKAQKRQHNFQVGLYKTLFDNMVKGNVSKRNMASALRINLLKELSDDIKCHAEKQMLDIKTLDNLLDIVFHKLQNLTCINQIYIEYVHQESRDTICHVSVDYNADNISSMYKNYMKFWKGQRAVLGVDIEDAWKCQKCDFESLCEWRKMKAEQLILKNKVNNSLKT